MTVGPTKQFCVVFKMLFLVHFCQDAVCVCLGEVCQCVVCSVRCDATLCEVVHVVKALWSLSCSHAHWQAPGLATICLC